MGHRALVAYERTDGQYALHYSHWGATEFRLADEITPSTPLGGDADTEWVREVSQQLAAGREVEDIDAFATPERERPTTPVDPEPLATGVSLDEVVAEHVDFQQYEAVYVVTPAYVVTPYRPVWFGLQYDCETIESSETVGNGVLVEVDRPAEEPTTDAYERGWIRALKSVGGDMVDRGALSNDDAVEYLARKVVRRAGDREVMLGRT